MSETELTICAILYSVGLIAGCFSAYCFGRADGIKWTRDLYNGKHDKEIFNP